VRIQLVQFPERWTIFSTKKTLLSERLKKKAVAEKAGAEKAGADEKGGGKERGAKKGGKEKGVGQAAAGGASGGTQGGTGTDGVGVDGVGADGACGHCRERRLFHGTGFEHIDTIIAQGFLRDYNDVSLYGKGTYFARDALYSVSELRV
jgi:hypothetical protein